MRALHCQYCAKALKNHSGLTRHLSSCKAWRILRAVHQVDVEAETDDFDHDTRSGGDAFPYTSDKDTCTSTCSPECRPTYEDELGPNDGIEQTRKHLSEDFEADNITEPSWDNSHVEENAMAAATTEDVHGSIDPLGVYDDLAAFARDKEAVEWPSHGVTESQSVRPDGISSDRSSASIHARTGRLSSAGSELPYRQIPFNVEGRSAGKPTGGTAERPRRQRELTDDWGGTFFQSPADAAFAHWLQQEGISSNAINRLLRDPRMSKIHELLSFKSAMELKDKLRRLSARRMPFLTTWSTTPVRLETLRTTSGVQVAPLRHRKVEDAVRFLLGHEGFKDELVYAPYRLETLDDVPKRIYSDMASADWWWDEQQALGVDGATIVPLILASDKTQVTNHQGDLVAWPVYLTVGNLPASIRNSNHRPGSVLLAMLPAVKGGDSSVKDELYHRCMKVLFDPVAKVAAGEGIDVACADGQTRRCFLRIAVYASDYQEQVMITGVKNNRHCTICKIDPDNREDLEATAPWRNHKDTQQQLMVQRAKHVAKDQAVHDILNFAFAQPGFNIHRTLMVDILHQLLKGVLMYVLDWTRDLLRSRLPLSSKRVKAVLTQAAGQHKAKRASKTLLDHQLDIIIDRRFAAVPAFRNLRVFGQISAVSQWTGQEQKSVLRQLLPVFVPLLQEAKAECAIRFLRAIVDFAWLAQYPSHDDETLRYMQLALFRMNQYKEEFREYRMSKGELKKAKAQTGTEESNTMPGPTGNFNFPKFHALTHYVDMIKLFGNAPDLDTGHFEHKHVEYVKKLFKLTNKKHGWEDQIMEHFRRKITLQTYFDTGLHFRRPTEAERREARDHAVPQPTEEKDIEDFFGWRRQSATNTSSKRDIWRTVGNVVEHMGPDVGPHFRHAAAAFVRECRARYNMSLVPRPTQLNPDRVEADPSWVEGIEVSFHGGVRCWKPHNKDPDDPSAIESDVVRCAPNWQNIEDNQRNDWLWVQEYEDPALREDLGETDKDTNAEIAFAGRLPARLLYVVTFRDAKPQVTHIDQTYTIPMDHKRPTYTGVFVDVFRPKDPTGRADEVHGMTVISAMTPGPWRGLLQGRRIYGLTSVYHSVHVVPTDEYDTTGRCDMFINNTADFETYNFIWNADWEDKEAREATKRRQIRVKAATTHNQQNTTAAAETKALLSKRGRKSSINRVQSGNCKKSRVR